MHKLTTRLFTMATLLAGHSLAHPGDPFPPAQIPEPGILELAGIGAAVAIAIAVYKRRK